MTYSPVYSAQFINYISTDGDTEFEVPPGFTAVVRYASYYDDLGAGFAYVYYQNSIDAPAIVFVALNVIGVNQLAAQHMRVVIPENGIITLVTASLGEGPQVYVGGYLLRNVVA